MTAIPLIAVVAAYRLKGMGDFPRDFLFPVLGLVVGTSLCAALNCRWEYLSVLGALFVLGAMPGHDALFNRTIYGKYSEQALPIWISLPLNWIFPKQQASENYFRVSGVFGFFIRGMAYQPLFIATALLAGSSVLLAMGMCAAFALAYGLAYVGSPYVVGWLYAVPPENSYNVVAEWACAWALMLCLWASL